MNSVILKRSGDIGYFTQSSEMYGLEILGEWFTDDVAHRIDSWIEWFNDRDKLAENTESNATWLEKEWLPDGGCNVTFGSIVDLIQDESPVYIPKEEDIIVMSLKNVLELLNTWQQLLKLRPNQIMIIEECGIYKMFAVQ